MDSVGQVRRLARQPNRLSVRVELSDALARRRDEIEQAALAHAESVGELSEITDPEYIADMGPAVGAALEYYIASLAPTSEAGAPPPPRVLLVQARRAARNGVALDTVLRRYFAGHSVVSDFVLEEIQRAGYEAFPTLQWLLRSQMGFFDQLMVAIIAEYRKEAKALRSSSEQRRVERIERLLAGDYLDVADLPYEFNCHHLAVVASGDPTSAAFRELATSTDCHLLLVRHQDGRIWAWFGSRRQPDPEELRKTLVGTVELKGKMAIGEPQEGISGWRFSHRQAKAAFVVAMRSEEPAVRYADVALAASMLQDDLLSTSLRRLYLRPLFTGHAGGVTLCRTLRAYFAAERNVSSASAQLGVSRHTVTNRLRAIEERLGRSLAVCGADIEAALRLEELETNSSAR